MDESKLNSRNCNNEDDSSLFVLDQYNDDEEEQTQSKCQSSLSLAQIYEKDFFDNVILNRIELFLENSFPFSIIVSYKLLW
jgi:hypothetical protein